MMKCPKCGQEITDKKQFCINCGAELYQEHGFVIIPRILLISIGLFISVGIILTSTIMFANTEQELSQFMQQAEQKITVDKLYGSFIINKIIPGLNGETCFNETLLGWNVTISESQFKLSACTIGCTDSRDITIEETKEHDFTSLNWLTGNYVEYKITDNITNKAYYILKTETSEYLYIQDSFLQLKNDTPYLVNTNYYRIILPSNTENEQVNWMIKSYQDDYSAAIESLNNSIIDYTYRETYDHNVTFLILQSSINNIISYKAIGYNETFELVSLETYLNMANLDLEEYKNQLIELFSNLGINPTEPSIFYNYYSENNTIHILINGLEYTLK